MKFKSIKELDEKIKEMEEWFKTSFFRKPRKIHVESKMDGYLLELNLEELKRETLRQVKVIIKFMSSKDLKWINREELLNKINRDKNG